MIFITSALTFLILFGPPGEIYFSPLIHTLIVIGGMTLLVSNYYLGLSIGYKIYKMRRRSESIIFILRYLKSKMK
jgi:hypothetical protein